MAVMMVVVQRCHWVIGLSRPQPHPHRVVRVVQSPLTPSTPAPLLLGQIPRRFGGRDIGLGPPIAPPPDGLGMAEVWYVLDLVELGLV